MGKISCLMYNDTWNSVNLAALKILPIVVGNQS